MKKQHIVIIGSGFGGLASACLLAKAGHEVTVLEKNDQFGGRAGQFEDRGFVFDMGPSWYLMPDIFEQFYTLLGERVEDHLDLKKLQPSYRVFFKDEDIGPFDFYSDLERDKQIFEEIEPGAGAQLERYLVKAKNQYEIARDRFIYKNYDSFLDFFTWELIKDGTKLSVFSRMQKYVSRYFSSDPLQKVMQYPLVFLGSSPYNTPAIYNIMSHIDFTMGVYYPMGGMYEIVKSLVQIAKKHGAALKTNAEVKRILVNDGVSTGVELQGGEQVNADIVVSNADLHHTEMQLLEPRWRERSKAYWERRTLAPSAFILYLGCSKKFPQLTHHNLIFSKNWKQNFAEIFDEPQWPSDPSLYLCAPSVTDASVSPEGKENIFVLVPTVPGLDDRNEALLDVYEEKILNIIADQIEEPDFSSYIEVKHRFTMRDFEHRYHSYKGTALGLAHTLWQTAIFRPDNQSARVKNLYYVGGNTNPGIGVPMCLVSAQLLLKRLVGDTTAGPVESIPDAE